MFEHKVASNYILRATDKRRVGRKKRIRARGWIIAPLSFLGIMICSGVVESAEYILMLVLFLPPLV